MKKTSLLVIIGLGVLSTTLGCGGNVIVDATGGGNQGGGGGGSTTTGSGTSTQPPDPTLYCATVCSEASKYGCVEGGGGAECIAGCEQIFMEYPECTSEIYALYDCALESLPTDGCAIVSCDDQTEAFGNCINGPTTCGEFGCFGGPNECGCEGECNGQYLEMGCKSDANGSVYCQCLIDGQIAGTCNDTSLSCDIFAGCCSAVWFQEG